MKWLPWPWPSGLPFPQRPQTAAPAGRRSRGPAVVVAAGIALLAWYACSPKGPSRIDWRGVDTGYQATTSRPMDSRPAVDGPTPGDRP